MNLTDITDELECGVGRPLIGRSNPTGDEIGRFT